MTKFNPLTFVFAFLCLQVQAQQNYFIAPANAGGDDNNSGSKQAPFARISKAIPLLSAGDTCFIRKGRYHESAQAHSLNGSAAAPIVIRPYQDEDVILDGCREITSAWTQHSGNIYKTSLDSAIWQVFIEEQEMVMAPILFRFK